MAASSSGDPPLEKPLSDELVTGAFDVTLATTLTYAGRIFLDRSLDERWYVTDTLTQEQLELPESDLWELDFHPESGRAVVFASEDEIILVDQIMKKNVYRHPDSGALILTDDHRADGSSKQYWLDKLKCKFMEGRLKMCVGSTHASIECDAYVLLRPRVANNRFYFCLTELYKHMQLTQYKKTASKWIFNCSQAWADKLRVSFGHGTLVMGTSCDREGIAFENKCFPLPALSTVGLMATLGVWSACAPQLGGFTAHEHRLAAREILGGLLRLGVLQAEAGVAFRLIFDEDWTCNWPRPDTCQPGREVIELRLGSNGLDLADWCQHAKAYPDSLPGQWWERARLKQFESSGPASLECVALHLATEPQCLKLYHQLMWRISLLVETHMLQAAVGQSSSDTEFTWLGFDVTLARSHDVDRQCASYVESCRSCRLDWQFLSMATDKGDGGGLPLQQTLVAFRDNQSFCCVPQAHPYTRPFNKFTNFESFSKSRPIHHEISMTETIWGRCGV
jgi:hypothetical protein